MSRTVDSGTGAPPPRTTRSDESRAGSNSGWRCRSCSIVGTAARTVASVASTRRITAVGSYAGMNANEAPTVRLASRPPIVPATWCNGSGPASTSSGPCPHPCTKLAAMFTAASCVMTAPFGLPRGPRRVLDEDGRRRVVRHHGVGHRGERVVDERDQRREISRAREPIDDALQSRRRVRSLGRTPRRAAGRAR